MNICLNLRFFISDIKTFLRFLTNPNTSEFSEITAYAKAPSRDSRKGACFLLRRIVLSSPDKETDRTLISRIGSEDAEDTQEQVDDVEVKIDCAVHCVIKCLRIHLRFAVVVADV